MNDSPSPEAEALPTLPVVAWREFTDFGGWHTYPNVFAAEGKHCENQELTPHAPAEAAIVALRAERDQTREGWTDAEAHLHACLGQIKDMAAERDALRAEVAELRKDAQRYRWLRLKLESISYTSGLHDSGSTSIVPCFDYTPDYWDKHIDTARASLLGDGGTL